jgi:hypothetical protein
VAWPVILRPLVRLGSREASASGNGDVGQRCQSRALRSGEGHAGTFFNCRFSTRCSAHQRERAAIVAVGFMPLDVGQMLPS